MATEWATRPLGECGTWFSGGTPRKSNPDYWSGEIPWISAKSLHDFFVNDSEDKVTTDAIGNGTRLIPEGSILFVVRGMSLKSEFRIGITTRPVSFNQDLRAIVPSNDFEVNFLAYAIKAQTHQVLALVEEAGHGTGVLPTELIKSLRIPTPSKREQKSIGDFFRFIDDKIELNRRMNETLESMARALFKSWFVDFDPVIDNALAAGTPIPEPLSQRAQTRRDLGTKRKPLPKNIQKLFPDSFVFDDNMGWIPEGWGVSDFGEVLESTIGGDWGKLEQDEKHTLPVVIIRGADIPDVKQGRRAKIPDRWVERKKFASRELLDGDIVIEVSGGSPARPTGRSVYVNQNIIDRLGGQVAPASFCRRFRPKTELLGLYASLHLEAIYAAGKMWGYQIQSTGIANFQTKTFLKTERILDPGIELLEECFARIRPLKDRATSDEQEALAKLRDTLLPKLLSGELRIPDAEQLVADSL